MFVKKVLTQVATKATDPKDAVKILAQGMSREQLAYFIVDALQRGWIDRIAMDLPKSGTTPLEVPTATVIESGEFSLDLL